MLQTGKITDQNLHFVFFIKSEYSSEKITHIRENAIYDQTGPLFLLPYRQNPVFSGHKGETCVLRWSWTNRQPNLFATHKSCTNQNLSGIMFTIAMSRAWRNKKVSAARRRIPFCGWTSGEARDWARSAKSSPAGQCRTSRAMRQKVSAARRRLTLSARCLKAAASGR